MSNLVTIEYMPEYLRASHASAGNMGTYPHNGADRYACSRELADDMIENFGQWCRIVAGANAAAYPMLSGYPE